MKKIKTPLTNERTFIVREKSAYHRKLWLDQTFIASIELSSLVFKNITEEIWHEILSAYTVDGQSAKNYVIEQNFETLSELWQYLLEGGRITNLDESCSCYVRLVDNELRFDNGELIEKSIVLNYPTSWKPFYPSFKMIKEEPKNLISYLLKLSQ
jgi:hypothetical protein